MTARLVQKRLTWRTRMFSAANIWVRHRARSWGCSIHLPSSWLISWRSIL